MAKRLLVPVNGSEKQSIRIAFERAIEMAKESETKLVLLTQTRLQLRAGVLVEVLGQDVCFHLKEGRDLEFQDFTMLHVPKRNLGFDLQSDYKREQYDDTIILATLLDEKGLDMIEALMPEAIVAVPPNKEWGEAWASRHRASIEDVPHVPVVSKPEPEESEDVNSVHLVKQRCEGDTLTARVRGSMGLYRVSWNTHTGRGRCSCPADSWCKHLKAILRAWKHSSGGFVPEGAPMTRNDFKAHDKRMMKAVGLAKQHLASGKFSSMGDAATAVANELGFTGDFKRGETGELVFLLEEICPDSSLWDWTDPNKQRGPEPIDEEGLQAAKNFKKIQDLRSIHEKLFRWVFKMEKNPAHPEPTAEQETDWRETLDQNDALVHEWFTSHEDNPPPKFWKRVDAVREKGRKAGIALIEDKW